MKGGIIVANILIVDDSATSRKILRHLLEEENHTIVGEAKDGEQAISLFSQLNPDIITMDINMPILDGISALKKIKEINKDVTVIMITTVGQRSKMLEAVKYGANEFITKPFNPSNIKTIIHTILTKSTSNTY